MATTNAGLVGSSIINTLGSIANAQNSFNDSLTMGASNSWGSSSSRAYNNQDAWSLMKSISDAYEKGESQSSSWSTSESHTYGREASAQDIENAAVANQIQKNLWQDQAEYNAKQAEIDREFQKEMSNTAYQRAVADLLAAGLNPILAVGNMGASTPVGAMASSGLATAHKANAFAESESYASSGSSSWSKNNAKSHSESGSASKSTGRSASQSSSTEGSHSENASKSHGETNTQLNSVLQTIKDQIALANKAMDGGSAKDKANAEKPRNGVTNWRNGQGYKK